MTVVTPAYNPRAGWEKEYILACKSIQILLKSWQIKWTIVDDGSDADLTPAVSYIESQVGDLAFFRQAENRGKGSATRLGAAHCTTDYLIFTDIDFPYQDQLFADIVSRLQAGDDIVLCTRGASYYQNISPSRARLSKAFRSVIRLLFRIPTLDTQAGLKGLSLKGIKSLLDTKTDRYLFDLEMVKIAHKRKLRFATIEGKLKSKTELSSMPFSILRQEFFNLVKILFR